MKFFLLRKLTHPCIVGVFDVFFDNDEDFFYCVLELLAGESLFDYIQQDTYYLTESQVVVYVKQLLSGLEYMHSQRIIHRDIKPENLVFDEGRKNLKFIDFGVSIFIENEDVPIITESEVGSKDYIAPEILSCLPQTPKVDMWSFGVVVYIMVHGFPPFPTGEDHVLYPAILQARFNFDDPILGTGLNEVFASNEAQHFIRRLLVVDSSLRASATQISTHVWLNK